MSDALECPQTAKSCLEVTFDVRFQHFYLREAERLNQHEPTKSRQGILSSLRGQLRCRTGTMTERVALRIETFEEAPVLVADDFADVVEVSYHSTAGELRIFTWPETAIGELPVMLEPDTSYRLRYHRATPVLGESAHRFTENGLLQLWPSPHREPEDLKITSSNGLFWHPQYAFTEALRKIRA